MESTAEALMSVDEFLAKHVHDKGIELVEGRIVRCDMPGGRDGEVCINAAFEIKSFVKANGLGRVLGNDTFFVVAREPATVRGPDVSFWSYARMPKDQPTPVGAFEFAPDLAVEVLSPSNRPKAVTKKVSEYLEAGVPVTLVFDPKIEAVAVYRPDELPLRLHNGDELTLPDVLPGFAVPVRRFFE